MAGDSLCREETEQTRVTLSASETQHCHQEFIKHTRTITHLQHEGWSKVISMCYMLLMAAEASRQANYVFVCVCLAVVFNTFLACEIYDCSLQIRNQVTLGFHHLPEWVDHLISSLTGSNPCQNALRYQIMIYFVFIYMINLNPVLYLRWISSHLAELLYIYLSLWSQSYLVKE